VSIHVTDLDKDDKDEIIIVTGGTIAYGLSYLNNVVYAFDGDGRLLWRRALDYQVRSSYMKDIDRDGFPEIIVAAGQEISLIQRGRMFVIDHNGQIIRSHGSQAVYTSLEVDDLDGDKLDEILGGSSLTVNVFDSFGKKRWEYVINDRVNAITSGYLFGLDKKGVLVGSSKLIGYHFNGTLGASDDISTITGEAHDRVESLITTNLMGENTSEIIIKTNKSAILYVFGYRFNSTIKGYQLIPYWRYPIDGEMSEIVVANIDDDDYSEILYGSKRTLNVLDNQGFLLWTYELNDNVKSITVSDLNNDGRGEVVVGTIAGTIYVLTKREGDFRWRYDLLEPLEKVTASDIAGDEYKEIVVISFYRNMHAFEVNKSYTELAQANSYYFRAQQHFIRREYNVSLTYLEKAKGIYLHLGYVKGIEKVESLSKIIYDKIFEAKRQQADRYYSKAKEYYISQEYEQAKDFAKKAANMYHEFDAQSELKAELLILRINKAISDQGKTTSTLSPHIVPEGEEKSFFLPILIIFLVLVAGAVAFVIVRKARAGKKMEDEISEYEKKYEEELSAAIDEDLGELEKISEVKKEVEEKGEDEEVF